MPHVGAERLRVQPRCDGDACVGMSSLMETEGREPCVLPALVDAAPQNARIDRPVEPVRTREQKSLRGVVEENEMIFEKSCQLLDDRNLARLPVLDRHEFLGATVPAAVDTEPASLQVDRGYIQGK